MRCVIPSRNKESWCPYTSDVGVAANHCVALVRSRISAVTVTGVDAGAAGAGVSGLAEHGACAEQEEHAVR